MVRIMSAEQTVTFYLHPQLRKQAQAGNHNFVGKMRTVLEGGGLQVAFDGDSYKARFRARRRSGCSLFLMDEPVNERSLTFRKTYLFPFWHIEKQAKRWEWPVVTAAFDPLELDARQAKNFYRFWRNRVFNGAGTPKKDGYVYVPLQGDLLTRRSFQFCSPIDMVRSVLEHDPDRRVMVTLHPNELYHPDEHRALDALSADNDRLFIRTGGGEGYLQNCDYIVTQNSSVGFLGYFHAKPLILFGQIDFHHIALNVADIGVAEAFEAVNDHQPDYAAYLYWFLQKQAINAGRDRCIDTIRDVFRGHGWPV